LASVLIGVHVLAIAALTLLTTLQWLMIITGLMVALSLYHAPYNYVLFRSKRAIRSLIQEPTGDIAVCDGKGRE
jgi:hypothetical protein